MSSATTGPRFTAGSPPGRDQSRKRVLGIDPSLRSTGVGVVERAGNVLRAIEYSRFILAPDEPISHCLREIENGIAEIILRTMPAAAA
ncbi:MAG: crossover junction endodeoxyribonuclease RuvC, partial [Kiritimatiellia bacterium]